jgi:uncharacterized protein (DUF2062 family)
VQVHAHTQNKGKAAALKTGFAAAADAGYTHAITIDTDGQHDPEEIPVLLEAARANPSAYVLGFRDDTRPDYPAKSRIGRRISNFFIRIESGLRVRDSQCGMRVYPLRLVQIVRCRAGHFGYEAEIITRAGWSKCPVVEVPIVTRYLPAGERVSHFRPWLDTVRGMAMHVRLVFRALAPWPHPKYETQTTWRRREPLAEAIWRWLNPIQAWREVRSGQISRGELSAALAAGVFIANLPVYGFQTILSLYTARRLHLQPVAVVAGSHISIPPVAPFLVAAAIGIGHLILHGTWPSAHFLHEGWSKVAGSLLLDWIVGGIAMGFALALITFLLTQAAFLCADRLRTKPRQDLHTPDGQSARPASLAQGSVHAGR